MYPFVCCHRFGLPTDRLWVSVYEDDDEAFEIWHDEVSYKRFLNSNMLHHMLVFPCS